MPEAVIVSTARSPIGRAGKGSLKDMRPDDLAAQMVRAALAKVPELDPAEINDLILGCGKPAGEGGNNLGRAVAVLAGMDHLPGVTVNRYCSSSLQTTRMAFHAIKAGEGDVFISAGVETVSRYVNGYADGLPTGRTRSSRTRRRVTEQRRGRRPRPGRTPATTGALPDLYIAMGQTAENVAQLLGHVARGAGRVRRAQPEPRRASGSTRASGPARSRRSRCPTAPSSWPTTVRAPATTLEASRRLKPVFRPDGTVTAGNCVPAQRRRGRARRHERRRGPRSSG